MYLHRNMAMSSIDVEKNEIKLLKLAKKYLKEGYKLLPNEELTEFVNRIGDEWDSY